jgi:hypothetical protein
MADETELTEVEREQIKLNANFWNGVGLIFIGAAGLNLTHGSLWGMVQALILLLVERTVQSAHGAVSRQE